MKTTPATPMRPGPRRVLVADDSPTVLHVVKRVLEGEGYTVVTAGDGREAFRILSADCDFAAAVFDVEMPCLTGPDLAKYMRTERGLMRIPVTMMTNERDPRVHLDAERRVLSLVAEALTNREIAERMFISVRTVEHHRANICAKLGPTGRNGLLTFALTHKSGL